MRHWARTRAGEIESLRRDLAAAHRLNEILIGALATLGGKINAQAGEIKALKAQREAALNAAGEALCGLIDMTRGRRR